MLRGWADPYRRALHAVAVRRRPLLPQRAHRRRRGAGERMTLRRPTRRPGRDRRAWRSRPPAASTTADGYWSLLSEQREALGPFPTDRGWAVRRAVRRIAPRRLQADPRPRRIPLRAQRLSIRSSSASRHARPSRWTRSSGSRCGWRGARWRTPAINPDDLAGHDVGCYVGASTLDYGPRPGRVLEPQRSSDHRHRRWGRSPGGSPTRWTSPGPRSPSTRRARRR